MKHSDFLRKLMTVSLLGLVLSVPAWSQIGKGSAKGVVVDAESGEPLIGAFLNVVGYEKFSAITDIDGNYSLDWASSLPQDVTVKVVYIGYEEKTIPLAALMKSPRVVLGAQNEQLEEVLVVGYGTQKKATSVGSITQTNGEEIMKGGIINSVSEALQGKLNGVVTVNSSGQPGASGTSIYIRGKATWGNTDPLVLVDGMERNMNDVDFNEIASISVLKDASATAVYGVRGANGVILVTTKRGSAERPTVSFSANVSVKAPTAKLEWADYVTALKMQNEAAANDGNWNSINPESTIRAWEHALATGNYGPYNEVFPQIDWSEVMLKPAVSQQYNINVDGRNEFLDYFASVGYSHDGSIYNVPKQEQYDPRASYDRLNWRSNFDFKVTKTTTFSVSVAGKMARRNEHVFSGNVFEDIVNAPTNDFPIKYQDGHWGYNGAYDSNPVGSLATGGQAKTKNFQAWIDAKLIQKLDFITPGLRAQISLSYNQYSNNKNTIRNNAFLGAAEHNAVMLANREYRRFDFTSPIYDENGNVSYPLLETKVSGNLYYQMPVGTDYDATQSLGRRLFYEARINYNRTFAGHEVGAMALVNRQKIDSTKSDAGYLQYPSFTEDWVGRVTYNYKERYLFEANISYTGSEKFAPGKRFGLFPSFSGGWRLSEEPFMKDAKKVLSNAKVRYSWGKVGSDAGATRWGYVQLFNQGGGVNFGKFENTSTKLSYTEGDIADPNATWETAIKQNLGIELGFINRLKITADLFNEHRQGILLTPRTTPNWVGAKTSASNIGITKNHGIDLEVGWQDKIGSEFHYYANFMFSTSENRIVFKDDPSNFLFHQKDAGKQIGWNKAYIATGNYETIDDVFNAAQNNINGVSKSLICPGDLSYLDYDGDGVVTEAGDKVATEYVTYPLTTYSLQLGFDWKGLSFSMMLYAPVGHYKCIPSEYLYNFPAEQTKAQPNVMDRWTRETANTTGIMLPSLHIDNNANKTNGSGETNFSQINYSYLRLKNAEIRYRIPKKALSAVKMSSAMVFVSGNNILTFWRGDKRVDPETDGVGVYPIVRSFTAGLRFSF